MMGKIFGREPALVFGFVGALLTVLVSLNMPWLSAGAAAAFLAALTGVATAALTRPIAPGLYVAALGSTFALLAEYGFNASDALVAGLTGLLLAGFALFGVRPAVSPRPPRE